MDELYKHGLNDIFIEVVLSVIKKFKIETKYSHLEATSLLQREHLIYASE